MVRISDNTTSQKFSDYDLVMILLNNSRKSFVDIAKELDVTETAVRKRIRKMEDQGIIERYSIDVNPKKLGYGMRVLIGIDTTPQKYITIIQELKIKKEVLRLYSSSGDHMIMIECWMKDDKELDTFEKYLRSLDGIVDVCPSIIKGIIK